MSLSKIQPISSTQDNQPQQQTQFPQGDIFHNYESDTEESPDKFDYLKAKYIFRFPHTLTSMKWGFTLGAIFGLHNYIKTRKPQQAIYWFFWGSVFTGLPIWGFFMFKYSFYTMTLRKFETEQYQQVEDSNLIKEFMVQKTGIKSAANLNDELLIKKIEQKQKKYHQKHSQLDSLLEDVDEEEFELIPKEFRQQNQSQEQEKQQ